jgi:hypothetical protein
MSGAHKFAQTSAQKTTQKLITHSDNRGNGKGRTVSSLNTGQKWLATSIAVIAAADTPLFFIVMFATVNGLLSPYFDGWAWTVPVATEASFTVLYLLELLLEWLGRPRRVLRAAPYLFAASSLALNVLGAHGQLAAVVGHAAVTLAFFVPLLVIKAAIRALLVPALVQKQAEALADARAYARDILRSALGVFWRFRSPLLLRRQLRSGRLPAVVTAAVESCDAGRWERAVEAWITAAVVLPERTREAVRAAREAVPEKTSERAPAASPGTPADEPASVPEAALRTRPKPAAKPALKLTAARSRSMTPERLAEHAGAMLDAYGDSLSLNRVKTDLSVGTDKAKEALRIAREERGRVVALPERKQA